MILQARPATLLPALLAATLLTWGCTESNPADDDPGWDVGGSDTGTDTGQTDTGPIDTYEATFELVNASGRTVYAYQRGGGTGECGSIGEWLTVGRPGADDDLRLRSTCTVCDCSETDCAVCALDCAPPTRDFQTLADGDSRRLTWDGFAWQTRERDQGICEYPEPVFERGTPLEATICYGTDFDDDTFTILDEVCETFTVDFSEPQQTFRVEVPAPTASEVTFRLINRTGERIYANPATTNYSDGCYGTFYTLGARDAAFSPRADCTGRCSCEQVAANPDEFCGLACPAVACAAPTRETFVLERGATREDTWSGDLTFIDEVNGQSCDAQRPPADTRMWVEFCWAKDLDLTGERPGGSQVTLGDLQCDRFNFDRTRDTLVEHVLR